MKLSNNGLSGIIALFIAAFIAGVLVAGMLMPAATPLNRVALWCDGAWDWNAQGTGTPETEAAFKTSCYADMESGQSAVRDYFRIDGE